MNKTFSKKLTKQMENQSITLSSLFNHIILIAIIAFLIFIISYLYSREKNTYVNTLENLPSYNPFDKELEYGQITPMYMSKEFASLDDEDINFHIVVDNNLYPYIVAINKYDINKYKDITDYNYKDIMKSDPINLIGKSVVMDTELLEYVVEAFGYFANRNDITLDSITNEIGYTYLDTTIQPQIDYSTIIGVLIIAVFMFVFYIYAIYLDIKAEHRRKATIEKYNDEQLYRIDAEINSEDCVYIKKYKLYITRNHVVSYYGGFDIIPIIDILHLYGKEKGNKNTYVVIAKTADGFTHEIACSHYLLLFTRLKEQIVQNLLRYNPKIIIGFEYGFLVKENEYEKIGNIPEEEVYSNLFPGIIGSLLGASIGVVIWIYISLLSNIHGLVGFITMYLSITGYRILSGFLDKKGKIISILIGLFMIFFANYLSVAFEFCKYYIVELTAPNIIDALPHIPKYLTTMNGWEDFIYSLILGYILALIAAGKILVSIFKSNNEISKMIRKLFTSL